MIWGYHYFWKHPDASTYDLPVVNSDFWQVSVAIHRTTCQLQLHLAITGIDSDSAIRLVDKMACWKEVLMSLKSSQVRLQILGAMLILLESHNSLQVFGQYYGICIIHLYLFTSNHLFHVTSFHFTWISLRISLHLFISCLKTHWFHPTISHKPLALLVQSPLVQVQPCGKQGWKTVSGPASLGSSFEEDVILVVID